MSNFKEASRLKLRFETSKGLLSVEQLWSLSFRQLGLIIKNLNKQLKKDNDDELSFLDEAATPVDKELQLKFNVVKDVFITLKEERDAEATKAAKKANNAKIEALIAQKEDEELAGLSVEELRKKLVD